MENQVISDLEMDDPKILFYHRKSYNRVTYLSPIDKKVFILMCKNFFNDMKDIHNMKIKTLKYWFLHNLSILFIGNLEMLTDFENISNELDIVIDYFKVIFQGKERQTDNFIFLPVMKLFSNWCNLCNNEKSDAHHKIIKDLIYLDDNYFFIINYFKNHNSKFITNIIKNKYEMEKGNNIMIHIIRSASFKHSNCSFKNFKGLINYLFVDIWENKFMDIMVKKNYNGKKALNLLVFLQDNFYDFLLNKIFTVSTHKQFMDKYFAAITKYINNSYQLEYIIDSVDICNNEKYQDFYERLINNKTIQFYEKYKIINLLLIHNLVSIENDKERLGRKLWDELNKVN